MTLALLLLALGTFLLRFRSCKDLCVRVRV
jgi:hypothetical protein